MQPVVAFILPFSGGFLISYLYSKVYDRLPKIKIKHFEFFPSVKILISGKVFHLHHWLGFSILLVISIFIEGGFLISMGAKGILSGGVIQALITRKNLKVIYKNDRSYTKSRRR